MMSRGSISSGDLWGIGAVVLIFSSGFVRFVLGMAIMTGVGMFFWDQFTEKTLPESAYEFTFTEPVADDMDGQRPSSVSPLFNLTWTLANKSQMTIDNMTLDLFLYRCDDSNQPFDTCDYAGHQEQYFDVGLPAGVRTSRSDQFSMMNATGREGVMRLRITVKNVKGDPDRDY